jgi:hypothetical protein
MRYKILAGLLIFLMASGCCAAVTAANSSFWGKKENKDIYVDHNVGNDDNPGTAKKPLKTIQQAFNKIPTKGTIHLAEGTYTITENTELVQKNLTIIGANRDKTVISGDNKVIYLRNGYDDSWFDFENVTITKFLTQGVSADCLIARNCIFIKNGNAIQCGYGFIDHCLFKENYGDAKHKGIIETFCHTIKEREYSYKPTTIRNCDFKDNTGRILIQCIGMEFNARGIHMTGCNFINQPEICLSFTPLTLPYERMPTLGGNYWDGAKMEEVIKKGSCWNCGSIF